MAKIIAECCQNHKGNLKLLEDMIWTAKEAGADYVKIQSILADDLTFRERFEEGEVREGKTLCMKRPYQPEYARLKPMDLDDDAHHFFIECCNKARIKPLTTVFSRSRIPFLASLSWDTIKIASFDCASYPMLCDLKERFRNLIISTGSTYKAEIKITAVLLKGTEFSFLHCVSIYPTPLDKLRLSRIAWLRQFTPSVGFSDHTLAARDGIKASIVALSLGAEMIERHFTLLPRDQTKDGPVSINTDQLKLLVEASRMKREDLKQRVQSEIPEWESFLGDPETDLTHEEELNRNYYRGRFVSRTKDGVVYNWEEQPVVEV